MLLQTPQITKILWTAVTFLCLLHLTPVIASAQFAGGSGTVEDPYQVETLDQLQAIADSINLDKHFIQIADIDAGETADWNNGLGFKPIGGIFRGNFDGNGHIISNLVINRPAENQIGLFRKLSGESNGKILRVGLVDADISGRDYVGAIAGTCELGFIHASFATGTVDGNDWVGGLVGFLGSVSSPGLEPYGRINSSYAQVNTSGNYGVGGIAGLHEESTPLAKEIHLSGLRSSQVNNAESTSENNGSNQSSIQEVYASGSVSGEEKVGGLIGVATPNRNYYAIYWNIETTGQSKSVGLGDSTGIKSLTTEQMTGQDAFINMYKLDFKETWQLTDGYPVLAWQKPENTVEPPEVPIVSVMPEHLNYGLVATDNTKSMAMLLKNKGTLTMSGELSLTGPDAHTFQIIRGEGEWILDPDSSLIVETVFHPEYSAKFQAVLQFTHNAPNEDDPLETTLSGTGRTMTSAEPVDQLPQRFELQQNYPNPFNPSTHINFSIPEQTHVRLEVYNSLGQRVAILVDEDKNPGRYQAVFDASRLSSGLYMYRLHTDSSTESKQMLLLK